MRIRRSVVCALLTAGLSSAAACGAEPVELSSPTRVEEPGTASCPDPREAAEHIGQMLPTYDYQGTASPAQLAEQVDLIVVGEVVEAGTASDGLWWELRNVSRVGVTDPLTSEMRVTVERHTKERPEPELLRGLQVLAFLHEDAHGGFQVGIEGLWLSCHIDDPAAPAMLEPAGDGWPTQPTISGIIELVVDPPQLVDGPVVRRSGMRALEAIGTFQPERVVRADGILTLDDACLALTVGGNPTPMIWPPGTTWDADGSAVRLADGMTLPVGENLSPDGMYVPAFYVQYVVGDEAQQALDSCPRVAADREAPVLVIDSL